MNPSSILYFFICIQAKKTIWVRKDVSGDLKNTINAYTDLIDGWFAFLPSYDRWMEKIKNLSRRMERSYQQCGSNLVANKTGKIR